METITQTNCTRCGVVVELDEDLNGVERYFTLAGTGFCGPRGRLNHKVA